MEQAKSLISKNENRDDNSILSYIVYLIWCSLSQVMSLNYVL